MKLKVFIKKNCPNCPAAKTLAGTAKKYLETEFFDVEEADGLAEAQFYSIMATPSLVLCDDSEEEKFSWRGEAPSEEDLLARIKE